jgi:MFS transporter, CP family, cyanate transporter
VSDLPTPLAEPVGASGSVQRAIPLTVVLGLFLASLALRPQLLSIGPLLPSIRADLDLPASVGGLITTIPVLCMGLFAPVGPRIAARLGPRFAFAICLGCIAGFGIVRALVPSVELLLAATLGIGIGIGMAGAVPSMVVSQHLPGHRAMGTGAYAGGIVAGSALAAAVAVPLALGGEAWQRSLAIISILSIGSLGAWLLLVRSDGRDRPVATQALRLPWGSGTAWLLVAVFGLQSLLFYGIVAWLPNVLVERGWTAGETGVLLGLFNGIGLITTLGVPLVADRIGNRRGQLVLFSVVATVGLTGVSVFPGLTVAWVVLLGLALGAIFPLVLTLPLDVADKPSQVGAVAALMLMGGYVLSSAGPFVLGAARDVTGDFGASLWLLVGLAALLVIACNTLSPARLHRGVTSA